MSLSPSRDPGLPSQNRSASRFARRYPGFALLVLAVALATLLPSALTVPQSGPSTLAEYAPVPGAGEGHSDLSDTGQATTGGLGFGSGRSGPAGSRQDESLTGPQQKRPKLKHCVGSPPRQTEDPMSPPCVAYFEGENGGATATGVTANEVTVVLALSCCGIDSSDRGPESSPSSGGQACDLDLPPNTGGQGCYSVGSNRDHKDVTINRALSKYFNDRFQTFGRRVHYWIYWIGSGSQVAAGASDIAKRFSPFAVVSDEETVVNAVASQGLMAFSDLSSLSGAFYRKHDPLIWGFSPDVEHSEAMFVSYVCSKVAPFPVAKADGGVSNDGTPMKGQPRRYGFLSTTDSNHPGLQHFARLAKADLAGCGVHPSAEATFPYNGATSADSTHGPRNVGILKGGDVNTVLVLGGRDYETGFAADASKYYPEIVHVGGGIDENVGGRVQNPNWFRNARVVSHLIRQDSIAENHGYQGCRNSDTERTHNDCLEAATYFYRSQFMLFKAIQAAGPRLSAAKVDSGLHAIAPTSSKTPYDAACYFDPSDFTCVKDAIEMWWDGTGFAEGETQPGCWRLVNQGVRYRSGYWPSKEEVFQNPADPCNGTH